LGAPVYGRSFGDVVERMKKILEKKAVKSYIYICPRELMVLEMALIS
jgi:hypothetical protein